MKTSLALAAIPIVIEHSDAQGRLTLAQHIEFTDFSRCGQSTRALATSAIGVTIGSYAPLTGDQ